MGTWGGGGWKGRGVFVFTYIYFLFCMDNGFELGVQGFSVWPYNDFFFLNLVLEPLMRTSVCLSEPSPTNTTVSSWPAVQA